MATVLDRSTSTVKLKVNNTLQQDLVSLPTKQQSRSLLCRVDWIGNWDPSMLVRGLDRVVSNFVPHFAGAGEEEGGREGKERCGREGRRKELDSSRVGKFFSPMNLERGRRYLVQEADIRLVFLAFDLQAPSSRTSRGGKVSSLSLFLSSSSLRSA